MSVNIEINAKLLKEWPNIFQANTAKQKNKRRIVLKFRKSGISHKAGLRIKEPSCLMLIADKCGGKTAS